MVSGKNLDPASSPSAFYGAEVRRLREEKGLSQSGLGELVFCSGAYIGQIEVAVRKPQADLSKRLDAALETGGYFARLYPMVARTRHAAHFARTAELEARAETISEYAPTLVPGLLQTPEYARAVIRTGQPFAPVAEVDDKVAARLERARILAAPTAPLLWMILHEAVLRTPVADGPVMANQLHHLLALAEAGKLLVQVMPFSAGAHAMAAGSIILMTFAEDPPVAYVEGPYSGQLLDDPAIVVRCQRSYDLARAVALSPEASLALIESAAEEYAHE
ncbi:helix-turn-helix transcriptional regulator [Kitasatospora sp. YST-16]|uniref:helix-turn-helix domain-containing protein n=1 Tax=Kitasatospora sp. YST-16 TaxID=2998080 RepID=UPI0022848801|nr:helix-turn-helix transcriptional regulator [Kitasatospora sp. YST-16]WAL73447.1 helix-turn-helix transcriptional regulator [Kitasatospora sp. YST-16]WNW39498.1 helix-turn-helix transcriptional regulator [Streptomyces sp. Li-HN-5-13]